MNKFVNKKRSHLSKEEESKLFNDWYAAKDSGNTRLANAMSEKIIIQYCSIIGKAVRKLRGYNLDKDEMICEGWLAMTRAIQDFDITKGFRFGTYAQRVVTLTLYTHVMKNFFITNTCANNSNKKLFFRMRKMIADEMKGQVSLPLGWAERISEQTGISVDRVQMMNNAMVAPYSSLNAPVAGDSHMTKQDALVSTDIQQDESLDNDQVQLLHRSLINDALNSLDDRTKNIIQGQLLCEDEDKHTLETLGAHYSISKERVRQIRVIGMKKVTNHIQGEMERRNIAPSDLLDEY